MSERGLKSARFAHATQRLRWPMLILICLLGATVSLVMARTAEQAQQRLVAMNFLDDVEENLTVITQSVESGLDQVRTLSTFIRSARRVGKDEFAVFVLPTLRRHPTLHSLGWIPRISDVQRPEFEQAASISAEHPFRIMELTPALGDQPLTPMPARNRPFHYPITFMEPRDQARAVMGFDVGSEPVRRAALERARDTGRLIITPPLPPVAHSDSAAPADEPQPASAGRRIIAFMPIYRGDREEQPATVEARREQLLGFATGSFLISEIVESPLSYWSQPDLQVYLFDRSLPEAEQLVYARHGQPDANLTAAQVMASRPLHAARALSIGGREWLLVSTPTPSYVRASRSGAPSWAVLAVGLTLTGLVALVLGGMIRGADRMAKFAAAREAANRELRDRIQEREEAEEALEQANRELRQVNADMERFVGAVSHDLKSPLVAAEMLISVMNQAVLKEDLAKVGETSRQIAKACGRMRRIIDDLLEHQKAGWADLRSSEVDMVEVALHVIEEHRYEAASKGVHLHLEDDLPTIRADRGRITALLDNLVSNALKYASDVPDPVVTIGSRIEAGEVRLFVQDNGPGIPEPDRDRMWELFQRLSRDENGTGIGLAIVQRVAEAHGGRAWVECPPPPSGASQDGTARDASSNGAGPCGGSIFWVALPADRLIQAESSTVMA